MEWMIRVEVPHSSTLGFPAGTSFTLALWFKGTKVGGALLGKTYLSPKFYLGIYCGMMVLLIKWLCISETKWNDYVARSTTMIADNKWHFM